jgi:hypothetical protein
MKSNNARLSTLHNKVVTGRKPAANPRWRRRLAQSPLPLIAAAAVLSSSAGLRAQSVFGVKLEQSCSMVTLDEPGAYKRGRSISMRLFPIRSSPNYKAGTVEDLRIQMAEELKKRLGATRFFESVDIVKENESPSGGYLLEGEFLQIDQGSRGRRIGGIGGLATVGVHARLLGGPQYSLLVAEFECLSHDQGGWSGLGGAKTATENNVGDIAKGLASQMVKAEKAAAKVASAKGSDTMSGKAPGAGIGKLNPVKRMPGIHRKPKQDASAGGSEAVAAKADEPAEETAATGDSEDENADAEAEGDDEGADAEDEETDPKRKVEEKKFLTTMVRARKGRTVRREVDAVWFTASVYQAQGKLVGLVTTPKDDLRGRSLRGGLLPANERLRAFEDQPVYVIAACYDKFMNRSPIVWNKEQAKATSLRASDGRTVTAVTVLDPSSTPSLLKKGKLKNPYVSRPVIFAFPAILPDGAPLVRNVSETLELHTQFEGIQVVLRFDLRRFGLRNVSELSLKPRAQTAGL